MKTCIGSWLALLLGLPGCASSHSVTGVDNQTKPGVQSETAATTSYTNNINRIVVAYNDETNEANHITYTPTDRVISAGTSLMGWSYSDDAGAHWTYGGKVAPPNGWAVLWGDPALLRFAMSAVACLTVYVGWFVRVSAGGYAGMAMLFTMAAIDVVAAAKRRGNDHCCTSRRTNEVSI